MTKVEDQFSYMAIFEREKWLKSYLRFLKSVKPHGNNGNDGHKSFNNNKVILKKFVIKNIGTEYGTE